MFKYKSIKGPITECYSARIAYRNILTPRTNGGDLRVMFLVSKTDHEDRARGALLDDQCLPWKIYDAVLKLAGVDLSKTTFIAVPCDAFEATGGGRGIDAETGPEAPNQQLQMQHWDDEEDDTEYASDVPAVSEETLRLLREHNDRFVEETVRIFKPDVVLALGVAAGALSHEWVTDEVLGKHAPSLCVGRPVEAQVSDHPFQLWLCPDPVYCAVGSPFSERKVNLLGYIARVFDQAINIGDLAYRIDVDRLLAAEVRLVMDMDGFHAMMDDLWEARRMCIDTEARSLAVISNSLQIIQFAVSEDLAYVLPVKHKDSPFTPAELREILRELGDFFYDNDSLEHVYHNFAFDGPMLKAELEIAHYCADVWDTMAGEFGFDENMAELNDFLKGLNAVSAKRVDDGTEASTKAGGVHSLLHMSVGYGCTVYLSGEFGKEDRVGIHAMSLDSPGLVAYCAYDVLIPMQIARLQRQRFADWNIKHQTKTVRHIIGDQLNTFATMRRNGSPVDVDYLWYINGPESPIARETENLRAKILGSPEVKKAEAILKSRTGKAKTKSLLGLASDGLDDSFFDPNRPAHQSLLFSEVLKLTSEHTTKTGKESYGKAFKEDYKDVELVSDFSDYGKAQKIFQAFLSPLLQRMTGGDPDCIVDNMVRSTYRFISILTGRVSSVDPNMQQIPSHGPLAKIVKECFVATPGTLYAKVDFSAHELRLWSIIGNDPILAKAFDAGVQLIYKFRHEPLPEYAKAHKIEGDIHRVNACTFGMAPSPAEVDDDTRSAVKGIAFGSIYGRFVENIAKALKKPVEFVQNVYEAFFSKLPNASNWLLEIEKVAERNLVVESCLGRRRNLTGLCLASIDRGKNKRIKGIMNALRRRARNSPIQGMGSDLGFAGARLIEKIVWAMTKHDKRWRKELPIKNCNMVHDSSESLVYYKWLLRSLEIIEYGLTLGNQRRTNHVYGMEYLVDLAIEVEIGSDLAHMEKWAIGFRDKLDDNGNPVYKLDDNGNRIQAFDKKKNAPAVDKKGNPKWEVEQVVSGDFDHLFDIVKGALERQRDHYKHDIDVDEVLWEIFDPEVTPRFLTDLAQRGYFKHAREYGYLDFDITTVKDIGQQIDDGDLDLGFYHRMMGDDPDAGRPEEYRSKPSASRQRSLSY